MNLILRHSTTVAAMLILLPGCGIESGFCLLEGGIQERVVVGSRQFLAVSCFRHAKADVDAIPYEQLKADYGTKVDLEIDKLKLILVNTSLADPNITVVPGGIALDLPIWVSATGFKLQFYGTYGANEFSQATTRTNTPTIVPIWASMSPRHPISLTGAPSGTTITHTGADGVSSTIPEPSLSNFSVGKDETIQINVPSADSTCSWSCGTSQLPCNQPVSVSGPLTCTYVQTSVPISHNFTVMTMGSGFGEVTATPDQAQCPNGSCSLLEGTQIVLLAEAAPNSTFEGWGGDCSALTGPRNTVTLDADKSCTATFAATNVPMVRLTVQLIVPNGFNARIVGPTVSIDCDETGAPACDAMVPENQEIRLELKGPPGDVDLEVQWTGAGCVSNQPTVTVTPTQNVTCIAEVSLPDPCATPAVPTIVLSVTQGTTEVNQVQPPGPGQPYELNAPQAEVNLSAFGSSSPAGELQYRWSLSDGTSGFARELVWAAALPFRQPQTTGWLTVTDQCNQTATLDFSFTP